jgi:hypothetical protein
VKGGIESDFDLAAMQRKFVHAGMQQQSVRDIRVAWELNVISSWPAPASTKTQWAQQRRHKSANPERQCTRMTLMMVFVSFRCIIHPRCACVQRHATGQLELTQVVIDSFHRQRRSEVIRDESLSVSSPSVGRSAFWP